MPELIDYKLKYELIEKSYNLAVIKGQLQGMLFIYDSLCTCEINNKGREWINTQINNKKTQLNKLQNESSE